MKIVRGTREPSGTVVLLGEGGSRKMRCMKCNMLTVETKTPSGKRVSRCQGCGAEYTSVSM